MQENPKARPQAPLACPSLVHRPLITRCWLPEAPRGPSPAQLASSLSWALQRPSRSQQAAASPPLSPSDGSSMARALSALLALLSAASLCQAVFVIEKGGLKVVLPQEAKEKYPGKLRTAPPLTRRSSTRPCAPGPTASAPTLPPHRRL